MQRPAGAMAEHSPHGAVGADRPERGNLPGAGAAGQPAQDRSASANSLADLLWLLDQTRPIPPWLYPGGRRVTKRIRVAQLAYGWARLLGYRLRGESCAIVEGSGLAYTAGWVTAGVAEGWRKAARSTSRLEPFIPVACRRAAFADVFRTIGIDPAAELSALPHENGHLVFRGRKGGVPCIVHYGRDPRSRATVMRHAHGLKAARDRLGDTLPGLLPELLAFENTPPAVRFVEQDLSGVAPPIASLSVADLDRMTRAALEPPYRAYQRFFPRRRLSAASSVLDDLGQLIDALPQYGAHLLPSLAALKNWSGLGRLTGVPSHGDYAPRNVLFSEDYSRAVGIYDWEWFWDDGVAGFDALKMTLEIRAERERKTLIPVLAAFLRGQGLDDAVSRDVRLVGELFDLPVADLWHIGLLIWLRILWIACVVQEPDSPAWLEQAVRLPAQAVAARGPADAA